MKKIIEIRIGRPRELKSRAGTAITMFAGRRSAAVAKLASQNLFDLFGLQTVAHVANFFYHRQIFLGEAKQQTRRLQSNSRRPSAINFLKFGENCPVGYNK
jgi:hypothetical protein